MFTRGRVALALVLSLVVLSVGYTALAGKLSSDEVIRSLVGVLTETQHATCGPSGATATNAIAPGSALRIVSIGGGFYYALLDTSEAKATHLMPWIPQNLVEYVQSPSSSKYFFCWTQSGSASAVISVIR